MKALIFAVSLIGSLIVSGCGNSDGSADTADGNRKITPKGYKPFVGEWVVKSLHCDSQPSNHSQYELIYIPDDASHLAVVTIKEDTANHHCKEVAAYSFAISSSNLALAASMPMSSQIGTLSLAALRNVCWKKTLGKREKHPYLDETTRHSGPSFVGALRQTQASELVFHSDSSPFCNNQKTLFIMDKK